MPVVTKSQVAQLLVANLPRPHRIKNLNLDYTENEIYFVWGDLDGVPMEWSVSIPILSVWRVIGTKRKNDDICCLMQAILETNITSILIG